MFSLVYTSNCGWFIKMLVLISTKTNWCPSAFTNQQKNIPALSEDNSGKSMTEWDRGGQKWGETHCLFFHWRFSLHCIVSTQDYSDSATHLSSGFANYISHFSALLTWDHSDQCDHWHCETRKMWSKWERQTLGLTEHDYKPAGREAGRWR